MTRQNKLRELENKKFKLIRYIKLCEDYKERIIGLFYRLNKQFNQGFISHEDYYERLNKLKYKEWIGYYDKSTEYYKYELRNCEKVIKKEEAKDNQLQYFIIFLALIGIIGLFLFIGKPEFGPTGFIVSTGEINATYYDVNTIVGGNVTIVLKIGDHIPNATWVNVSFSGQENYTTLEDFTYASYYLCDANSSTTKFSDIDNVWTWEADTGYGYSYNESADCTDNNFTVDLDRLFPGGLIAPSTQGIYFITLNATYQSTNEQVTYSQTSVQVGQIPTDPVPLVNSTVLEQSNYTNETLACNFLCSDPDTSDTLTYDIDWIKNGITSVRFTSQSCGAEPSYNSPQLTDDNTTKNELWSCSINITDIGGLNSSTIFSDNVTINNYPPSIPDLNLPANNSLFSNIFTVELNWSNVSQLDPDLDSYNYYLEIWNESIMTNILYANSSISETTNTTSDLVTFPSESADYFWRVLANDGTANSSWSELRNISFYATPANTAPSVPSDVLFNSTLVAQTNLTNENLAANFLCSDPDTGDTLTYDIYFYNEGIYNQSITSVSCSDPEYVTYIFDSANTSKGENWSFSVNVTDVGGLSSNTVFSNNVTIENTVPTIIYVSLNETVAPLSGGIRQFEFSFVANDNDGTSDLNAATAKANISLSSDSFSNTTCNDSGDITGGRNYSCTMQMQYYYPSNAWSYGAEIKDNDAISVQNSTNINGEEQSWYYSQLVAINLSINILTWPTIIPLNTNETSTSNPVTLENIGNKPTLNIRSLAIDLAGPSSTIIPAENFTIGNITSASKVECDFTNQTSSITPGILPLTFINNTNVYPVIGALARGQGSSENLYYCLFDIPGNLLSGAYNTDAGGTWDISVE